MRSVKDSPIPAIPLVPEASENGAHDARVRITTRQRLLNQLSTHTSFELNSNSVTDRKNAAVSSTNDNINCLKESIKYYFIF